MADITAKIIEIIEGQHPDLGASVFPESDLHKDLGLDSLDAVELALALEEEYEITLPDEDLEKLRTVKELAGYIGKKKVS